MIGMQADGYRCCPQVRDCTVHKQTKSHPNSGLKFPRIDLAPVPPLILDGPVATVVAYVMCR